MPVFYLLSAPNCHLCTQALVQIQQQAVVQIQLNTVDITADKALFDEYQHLIPVLVRASDDAELRWPFNDQLTSFIGDQDEED